MAVLLKQTTCFRYDPTTQEIATHDYVLKISSVCTTLGNIKDVIPNQCYQIFRMLTISCYNVYDYM